MFEYDAESPLDYEEHGCKFQNGVNVCEISYASPHGGRVSALLLIPEHDPPLAGILFMHPSGTNRYVFLKEASIFAKGGCEALLIDDIDVICLNHTIRQIGLVSIFMPSSLFDCSGGILHH